LPENLIQPLKDQFSKARRLHAQDLEAGGGDVYMPEALARKYPRAARAWGWQFVFPSPVRSVDPRRRIAA
ncbi:MAG: integron integrase, partial [Gammaproteobacteria bacterium]|nr:integron integrase [Gammaproteobacteria bacterium]